MPNTDGLNRTLFIADNLPMLRGLDSESVDLIATDPPFNKGFRAFEGIVTAGVDRRGWKVSYKDIWTWGDVQSEWADSIRQDHPKLYAVIQGANAAAGEDMGAFLCWLGVRVLEMHRILKPSGSMYLHLDHTAGAWGKAMMDAIFGRASFRNEIVWRKYGGYKNTAKRRFTTETDKLLFYVKGDSFTFNQVFRPLSESVIKGEYKHVDENGRKYAVPRGRMYRQGIVKRVYLDEHRGVAVGSLWAEKELTMQGRDDQRTGYPTQKPLALYERIIRASSNEGDLVLDPFAGCATTCVAAERLGRRWIAIDLNEPAREVTLERLQKEVTASMDWQSAVTITTVPPTRTDDGAEAAPELVLVSPRPRAPRYTARELRATLVLSDGRKCQGCGWVPHHEEYLDVDHRVPKSREGRDDLRNRVLLCGPCNGAKGNKLTLAELRLRRIEEDRMVEPTWDRAWYERTGRFG